MEQKIRAGEQIAEIGLFKKAVLAKLNAKYGTHPPIEDYFSPKESYSPTVCIRLEY